ncbi:MAG: hypothetical protein HOW73_28710 [Polyangiaceae bacterium]|nr:hypothetical protein [Polyangiaceae bacterium]
MTVHAWRRQLDRLDQYRHVPGPASFELRAVLTDGQAHPETIAAAEYLLWRVGARTNDGKLLLPSTALGVALMLDAQSECGVDVAVCEITPMALSE